MNGKLIDLQNQKVRRFCLEKAINVKALTNLHDSYKEKDVISLAAEFEDYVLNGLKNS